MTCGGAETAGVTKAAVTIKDATNLAGFALTFTAASPEFGDETQNPHDYSTLLGRREGPVCGYVEAFHLVPDINERFRVKCSELGRI